MIDRELRPELLADPFFAAEMLPLLFVEDRLTHRHERLTLQRLRKEPAGPLTQLLDDYEAALTSPGFRLIFGNPEFDTAVHEVLVPLTAALTVQDPPPVAVPMRPGTMLSTTTRSGSAGVAAAGSTTPRTTSQASGQGEQMRAPTRRPGGRRAFSAQVTALRQELTAAAWPQLRACMALWRPLSVDHIAPVVLFADPVLAEMITPERGREILAMHRAG